MNRSASILLLLLIFSLILFDTAQQKYYLDTFSLAPAEETVFLRVLGNHLTRWFLWMITAIPYGLIIWKVFFRSAKPTEKSWIIIGSLAAFSTLIALLMVSVHSMISQDVEWKEFGEFFEFFIYQKGLNFSMATITLTLLLFNHSKSNTISQQSFEIRNLQQKAENLKEALKGEETPHLNVKTGYKLKSIPLNEIVWIQSDDYCVKIHTRENSFTLRQSLKLLEEKLEPFNFIRIHRTALLNVEFLDQINFDSSKVKLTNEVEIPFSKKRIKILKERVRDLSA